MSLKVQHLLIQNPWWEDPSEVLRDSKVVEALSRKPQKTYSLENTENTILLGPRQVGKTTYLKLMIRHLLLEKKIDPRRVLYFSCELLNTKEDIVELLKLYDRLFPEVKKTKYILLDEITFVENWEAAVKHILDTQISRNRVIYITGSSSIWLLKGSEKMPGRNISVKLFMPMCFREYAELFGSRKLREIISSLKPVNLSKIDSVKKLYREALKTSLVLNELNELFLKYLKTGGFYKSSYEYLYSSRISEETYLTYVKWIEGDVAKLNRRISLLRPLITAIVEKLSTRISYASLAKISELKSHITVRDYIEILEGLLLLRVFYQVDLSSKTPNYRKEKKVYFTDPFLYNVFKGYSHEVYRDYSVENADILVENIIGEHLARQFRRHKTRVMYYCEVKETDFVLLKENLKLLGIEVKWQKDVKPEDFPNRHRFKEKILVTMNDLDYCEKYNMALIPASVFLILLDKHQLYKVS